MAAVDHDTPPGWDGMSITAERYDGTNWVEFDYVRDNVTITQGSIATELAPKAAVTVDASVDIVGGDSVRFKDPNGTVFFDNATARSTGTYRENGSRDIEIRHRAYRLFEDEVTFGPTTQSSDSHLQDALDNANIGGEFTLNFTGTASTFEFEATDTKVKTVFRDVLDQNNLVGIVEMDTKTINVVDRGSGVVWRDMETERDNITIQSWKEGDVETVINDVKVEPAGGIGFFDQARATDSTSISTYGRRAETFKILGILTQSVANDFASALLQPDPLGSGSFQIVGGTDFYTSLIDDYLEVTDTTRNLSNDELRIERQTIRPSRVILDAGEGAGELFHRSNRKTRTTKETTTSGTVMPTERIADDAIGNAKLVDLSIDETKIQDDAISTPKLQAEAVTANEIKTNTITASQIDVLDLDTGALSVGDQSSGDVLDFVNRNISGITFLSVVPSGSVILGSNGSGEQFDIAYIDQIDAEEGIVTGTNTATTDISPGEAIIYPDAADTGVAFTESETEPTVQPQVDFFGKLGDGDGTNASKAWFEIHTHNLLTYSPEPIATNDPRRDTATDGGPPVDLSALPNQSWGDPPDYVSQKEVAEGEFESLPSGGVELSHMANYLLEVCKAQQSKIDDLEQRLTALEQQV